MNFSFDSDFLVLISLGIFMLITLIVIIYNKARSWIYIWIIFIGVFTVVIERFIIRITVIKAFFLNNVSDFVTIYNNEYLSDELTDHYTIFSSLVIGGCIQESLKFAAFRHFLSNRWRMINRSRELRYWAIIYGFSFAIADYYFSKYTAFPASIDIYKSENLRNFFGVFFLHVPLSLFLWQWGNIFWKKKKENIIFTHFNISALETRMLWFAMPLSILTHSIMKASFLQHSLLGFLLFGSISMGLIIIWLRTLYFEIKTK